MKRQLEMLKDCIRTCALLSLTNAGFLFGQVQSGPVIRVHLQELVAPDDASVSGATLSFLSDKRLAIGGCGQETKHCRLTIVDVSKGGFPATAETANYTFGDSLFRSIGNGVISNPNAGALRAASGYSSDLKQTYQLSKTLIDPHWISASGKTFGEQLERNTWQVYNTSVSPKRMAEGRGELLSVSDEVIVYQEQSAIRIDQTNGTHVGEFKVKPASKCLTSVQVIGEDRLWVSSCDGEAIRDFSGKVVTRRRRVEGWGLRVGQSSDGHRVLYDRYTRQISRTRKIAEAAIAVTTLGLGVHDEESNGELVRVVDVTSGDVCLEWRQSEGIGEAGLYHADISPSGRLVAIVTRTALALYTLPVKCRAQ